jgi:release factor glutamine methyltransferase
MLQKLTTQPPDDSMVEVALKAFTTVLELEDNLDKPVESFVTYTTVEKAVKELSGIAPTKNEAELILMHTTGAKTFPELYERKRISSVEKDKAIEYAIQRQKGQPLQYVLGNACFYGYDFFVDERVLIPRFDTEHLVKAAVDIAKEMQQPAILDLMTGSGAIAVAIRKSVDCSMTATDISGAALEVAHQNAKNNDCEISFLQSSIFESVEGKYDIICCNPPYIPEKDIAELDSEVKDFEPLSALNGGEDGLDFYRKIVSAAPNYLNAKGYLLLEAGAGQAEIIKGMLDEKFEVEFVFDLNNPPIARVLVAQLKDQ